MGAIAFGALVPSLAVTATAPLHVGAVPTSSSVVYNNAFDSGGREHGYGIAGVVARPSGGGQHVPGKMAVVDASHRIREAATTPLIQTGQTVHVSAILPAGATYVPFTEVRNEWYLNPARACLNTETSESRQTCTVSTAKDGRQVVTRSVTAKQLSGAWGRYFWNNLEASSFLYKVDESTTPQTTSVEVRIDFPVDEKSSLPDHYSERISILAGPASTLGAYNPEVQPNNPGVNGTWQRGDKGVFRGTPQVDVDPVPLAIRRGETITLQTYIWSRPERNSNNLYYDPDVDPDHPVDDICVKTPPDGFSIRCDFTGISMKIIFTRTGPDTDDALAMANPIEIPVARHPDYFYEDEVSARYTFVLSTTSSIGAVSNTVYTDKTVEYAPRSTPRLTAASFDPNPPPQTAGGVLHYETLTGATYDRGFTERITLPEGMTPAAGGQCPAGSADDYVVEERDGVTILERDGVPSDRAGCVEVASEPAAGNRILIEIVDSSGLVFQHATVDTTAVSSESPPVSVPGESASEEPSPESTAPPGDVAETTVPTLPSAPRPEPTPSPSPARPDDERS